MVDLKFGGISTLGLFNNVAICHRLTIDILHFFGQNFFSVSRCLGDDKMALVPG